MIKVFTEGIRRRLRILWEKAIWPLIKMNYSISKGFYIRYPEVSKHEKIDLSTVGYMDEYSEEILDYFSFKGLDHVKLIVDSGVYSLYVNGKCLLSITEKIKICKGDSLALILWEDSHNRPISCEISNIQLSKIA